MGLLTIPTVVVRFVSEDGSIVELTYSYLRDRLTNENGRFMDGVRVSSTDGSLDGVIWVPDAREFLNDVLQMDTNSPCFVAGTPILTPFGEVPIEDLKVGDTVLAFDATEDGGRGRLMAKKVANLFHNTTEDFLKLTWSEDGAARELITTPGHHFLREDGTFGPIMDLVVDGEVRVVLQNGQVQTCAAEHIVYSAENADLFGRAQQSYQVANGSGPVFEQLDLWATYNFEVEDCHTYVAGGVRVHNECLTAEELAAVVESHDEGTMVIQTLGTAGDDVMVVDLMFSIDVDAQDSVRLHGHEGNDRLYGGDGWDYLWGGKGADYLDGGKNIDVAAYGGASTGVTADLQWESQNRGEARGDTYVSIEGLSGSAFNDSLRGDGGNNLVYGNDGNDLLSGRGGNDLLKGNDGKDTLVGGSGDDTFEFDAVSDSMAGSKNRDLIRDFVRNSDIIDLESIDANTLVGGNQAFHFIGRGGFEDAGDLRYQTLRDGSNLLSGDVNGDGRADFQIHVMGTHWMTGTDFVL